MIPRARIRRWRWCLWYGSSRRHDIKYFFASTLPSSTAGWSNGSTPRRCAAMIVSSMKCIINSPRAAARNGEPRKLRQGLAAKAGPASAQNNDVSRAVRRLTRGISDHLEVHVGFRQAQQRQSAVGMHGPNPDHGTLRPRQSGLQGVGANAVRPDLLFAGALDRLDDVHAGISLESRKRRNGRKPTRTLFRSLARRKALWLARNRHQQSPAIQALGDPLGILDCHCIDQRAALLNIIDAEIVDLDLGQLRRDLA